MPRDIADEAKKNAAVEIRMMMRVDMEFWKILLLFNVEFAPFNNARRPRRTPSFKNCKCRIYIESIL